MPELAKTSYLIVKGNGLSKPDYSECTIQVYKELDLSKTDLGLFYCSPLHSFEDDGSNIPHSRSITSIHFLFIPNLASSFKTYFAEVIGSCWFTIGLANVVIFEEKGTKDPIDQVIKDLDENNLLCARETWEIEDSQIAGKPNIYLPEINSELEFREIHLNTLALDVNFIINELCSNLNKFLCYSQRYTPQHFEIHKNLYDFVISEINKLIVESEETNQSNFSISESYGVLVQFNSALTYVLNQIFTGITPILFNNSFFNRYSLLGAGSAVSGLFEISHQLESIFTVNILETIEKSDYAIIPIPEDKINAFQKVLSIQTYSEEAWKDDLTRDALVSKLSKSKATLDEDDIQYTRLSFFSGRYGFREYGLSASAATQVLVEGSTMKWHAINYSHEVIHNHVRQILYDLLYFTLPNNPHFDADYNNLIEDIFAARRGELKPGIKYLEYFRIVFGNFIMLTELYGSLSYSSTMLKEAEQIRGELKQEMNRPTVTDYFNRAKLLIKDISEILTHCFDFAYVYSYESDLYIRSIWQSWSEIPIIYDDLDQYILRSLLILAREEDGESYVRYEKALSHLNQLTKIQFKDKNDSLIKLIEKTTSQNSFSLKSKFKNCIVIADLTFYFFTLKLNHYFGESDMFHSKLSDSYSYEYECPDLKSIEGNKKIRMAFSELHKLFFNGQMHAENQDIERHSAWLFLMLSNLTK